MDLKQDSSYSASNNSVVLVPKAQRFEEHSKGLILKLCGSALIDGRLPQIEATRNDTGYISLSGRLKQDARNFYKLWAKSAPRHAELGAVNITRVGWRHMTRKGRHRERIAQSFQLLGIAKRMTEEIPTYSRLGHVRTREVGDRTEILDYVGLRARVTFPHRDRSVVQVVIRRRRIFDNEGRSSTSCWFYSVYELRRGGS